MDRIRNVHIRDRLRQEETAAEVEAKVTDQ